MRRLSLVQNIQDDYPYLYFICEEDSQFGFSSYRSGSLEYSIDKNYWEKLSDYTPVFKKDTIVYWRGDLTPISYNGIGAFSSAGRFSIGGNPKSLLKDRRLVDYVFRYLFNYCSNLTNASDLILDDDVLTIHCYNSMFYDCTSLTQAPVLPATTLANYCYYYMFSGCTNLVSAPELPAKTLVKSCYYSMFSGCTNLVSAPVLPATTLADDCYNCMFFNCTSLTTAPELPATTLADDCYYSMFFNCTSLTTAPELPATTLVYYCYSGMFRGCSSLIEAPALPATTLTDRCYGYMFNGCPKLNKVICYATTNINTTNLNGWLSGVSPTGDFYKVKDIEYPSGVSGIPTNWTTHNIDYLTFEVVESSSFSFTNDIEYKVNDGNWSTLTKNTNTSTFKAGDKIYWRGDLTPTSSPLASIMPTSSGIGQFSSTSKFKVSGDPKSLLKDQKLTDYAFCSLFHSCSTLTDASGLVLDDVLVPYCYYYMFYNCKSLTQAPSLPAKTLAIYCYYNMFRGCTSLTQAPSLPAKTLADDCYSYMFYGCTSLTVAPELPATTLVKSCYYSMFSGCTNLVSAPELPAKTLVKSCYYYMFRDCSKLNKVICHAISGINTTNIGNWLSGVSPTGDFYKDSTTNSFETGGPGIPSGWTQHDISPLKFTALKDSQFSFTNDIQYKIDEGEWMDLKANELTTIVPANSTIYWKGELEPNYLNGIGTFSSTNKFKALGNPIQILKDWKLVDYAFSSLFYGCDKLTDASEMVLDADTLTSYCCSSMFMNCTSLESTPTLPATTLGIGCYSNMFNGCTSLTTTPELPSTTLVDYCYNGMFYNCPINTLVCVATENINEDNLMDWLYGVSESGTFTCSLGTGDEWSNYIPGGWMIIEK